MDQFFGVRSPASVVVGLTGIAIAIGTSTVMSDTSNSFPVNAQLLQVFQTTALPPGDGVLPPVVARVDGTDISSELYARELAMIRNNNAARIQPLTDTQMRQAAMDALVRDEALYSRAISEGIPVTDDEVRAYMQSQQSLLSQGEASKPGIAADANAAMAANGDMSQSQFWADPKVIAQYRRYNLEGKLIAAHVGPGASVKTLDAFVADTVASAKVQIFITL